jgi:DNA polymerase-3 subunit alpha
MADEFEEKLKKLPPPPPEGANFVPLHCHSHFSVLDGLNSPEEIALRARELGHPAVALTDHGSCGGLYHFQKACKKCGIKPILGMEAYVVDNAMVRDKEERKRHLTIWATNQEGYKNLIALSSKGYLEGFYSKPRISLEDIDKRKAGLLVGSACIKGIVCDRIMADDKPRAIETAGKLKDMLGDAFYCEVMSHRYDASSKDKQTAFAKAMKAVLEVADTVGIKSVLTYDSHYCRPEDAQYHDVLLSIQTKDTIKNPNRFSFHSSDFYMKPWDELVRICSVRKDLLSNTLEVASRVSSEDLIKTSPPLLPDFQLPQGVKSEEAYLKELIREGMIERGIFDKQEYRDRIMTELEVITKCGFVRYFLILWDVVNYARRSGIAVGPGRGSGAASLCLYSLSVTQLDPIKHDLLFARFLNPDRVSPPDVDLDFDDSKQEEMFNYVARKYGQECVSRIGSYTAPKVKDAIRRTAKALDVGNDWEQSDGKGKWKSGQNTMDVVSLLAKVLPDDPKLTMDDALKIREVEDFVESYPKLFEVSKRIMGTLVASGVHPAGIIISKQKVVDMIPLRMDTDGVVCTQFDMKEVEPLGMLKFDFLAIKNLRVIDKCLKMVKVNHGDAIKIDALETNDPAVFKLLNDGKVDGIFQFESGEGKKGISGLLRDIRVDSFEDMIVTCALYRPGTIKAKVHTDYPLYKHGKKAVKYVHPMMKELLHETYGMMVYQEQVMLVSMRMAGFTNVEADWLRKAMGKKDPKIMEKLEGKFVSGCIANGISPDDAKKVFDLCSLFSGYGFNRAHAAAYAMLAYQTAWLKTHYPVEYMCSLMSANAGDDKKIPKYERATESMGIQMLPHHINKSKADYSIEGRSIRRPLSSLKGIGDVGIKAIVASQPFDSLNDFVAKVDAHAVNIRVFTVLVEAKCMECFGMTKNQLETKYAEAKKRVKQAEKQKERDKGFDSVNMFDCPI